jgi:hypothetical protein
MREHAAGNYRRADSLFSSLPTFYFHQSYYPYRFGGVLLEPVLRALRGDRTALARTWRDIREERRFVFGQLLWHEAGYLAGEIAKEQFLGQPYGRGVKNRHVFFGAIRDDIAGNAEAAAAGYHHCRQLPALPQVPEPHDIFASETVKAFLEWRLDVLSSTKTSGGAG